jgi:ribosomal-protein-alanine N-acetyltransferase
MPFASFYTEGFWKKKIRDEKSEFRDDRGLTLYLFLKDEPRELVGIVRFDAIIRSFFQSCFLGYLLGESFEGKGLMSEALRAAIPFAFEKMNLHRISAAHELHNKRSCRVLKKLGFKNVGVEPRYLRINGKWRDHEVHVLINSKWVER